MCPLLLPKDLKPSIQIENLATRARGHALKKGYIDAIDLGCHGRAGTVSDESNRSIRQGPVGAVGVQAPKTVVTGGIVQAKPGGAVQAGGSTDTGGAGTNTQEAITLAETVAIVTPSHPGPAVFQAVVWRALADHHGVGGAVKDVG